MRTEGRKEARVEGAAQAKEMLAYNTILAVMRSWLCVRAVLADGQSGKSSTRFPKVTADTWPGGPETVVSDSPPGV